VDLPAQDFYAFFDYVKYQQPIKGEEIFFSNFDDGTLQGWGTRDYSGITTERPHSGSYSIKVNDIVAGGDMAECYRIFDPVERGTAEFWMYVPSGNNAENGISLADQSSWHKYPNHRFYISVSHDGSLRYYHNGQYHDFPTPASISFNTWNKIKIVWDSSANQMQLYINGLDKGKANNWNAGGAISQLIFQSGCWGCVGIYAYFDDVKVTRQ